MTTFGRFEFGAKKPTETFEGDSMTMDKGYIKIFVGEESKLDALQTPRLIVAIHLDKGQSMREIKAEATRRPV
jgi:hypothetical protein